MSWLTTAQSPVDWLIPDLIPQSYLITLIAGEGIGKSALSYTLGMALATGLPVLGRTPAAPRTVLYFDCENASPDAIVYAQRTWIGLGRPNLTLLEQNFGVDLFTLGDPGWPKTVTERVKTVRPSLIVFDTAISCCPPLGPKGEDDNADASRTITKIREICRLVTPHASALILKHAKQFPAGIKDYDVRGSKAWKGAADSVLYLERLPRIKGVKGHPTKLWPMKTRAFGLQEAIHIRPVWIEDGQGLKLEVTEAPEELLS